MQANYDLDSDDASSSSNESHQLKRDFLEAPRKLFPDYAVSFGDGGAADLDFPVYSMEKLDLDDEEGIRKRLKRQLRAVGELRKDVQPNGVVHDIVDPSLHANVLSDEQVAKEVYVTEERNKSLLGHDAREVLEENFDDDAFNRGAKGDDEYRQIKAKRGRFQWVPAIVRCSAPSCTSSQESIKTDSTPSNKSWKAQFLSPIAGVPERQFSPQFYGDMESIFAAMLPMFVKLGVLDDKEGHQDLQVITKVQEYVLPPGAKYTGRWHTEGFTERIIAAGVYYIEVDRGSGGNLLFRPPVTPGMGYDRAVHNYQPRSQEAFSAELPFGSKNGSEFTSETDIHPDDKEQEKPDTDTIAERIAECIDDSDNVVIRKVKIQTELHRQATETILAGIEKKRIQNFHTENLCSFRRYIKELEVSEGTSVAFLNNIPHRFKTISTYVHRGRRRLFVNFFIVDPKAGLTTTTANTASHAEIRRILFRNGLEDADICNLVCAFCGGYSKGDLVHRTVVRDQARSAMSVGRQHWKTQYFGNAGHLQFHPDARWNSKLSGRIGIAGRNYEHSAKSSELGSGM